MKDDVQNASKKNLITSFGASFRLLDRGDETLLLTHQEYNTMVERHTNHLSSSAKRIRRELKAYVKVVSKMTDDLI